MTTISLCIDDQLSASLDALCAESGRDKGMLLSEVVRHYVETEQFKRALADPALKDLYQELSDEDVKLAEGGIAEYQTSLLKADQLN